MKMFATSRICFSVGSERSPKLILLLVITLVCGNSSFLRADDKVRLLSVSSQTADFVVFQISSRQHSYALGEDLVINYTVRNNSGKPIYLVSEPKPRLSVDQERYFLRVESPVKYQDEFTQYDNDLIKILPRRTFSGKLVIKANEVPRDKESESEDWDLQVGFSYVFDPSKPDISELLGCKNTKYSFPCLGKLLMLSRRLTVGNLVIEVKNH